ncbi:MAG: hypothetical protein A2W80_01040 [Candidatus Riflebacteria bacterium GWC2_50_8]|nr:MAG: hypothetical protein A2W80_01040 [Candidatus Riflebacteria bacterium GWC2_50_8]
MGFLSPAPLFSAKRAAALRQRSVEQRLEPFFASRVLRYRQAQFCFTRIIIIIMIKTHVFEYNNDDFITNKTKI